MQTVFHIMLCSKFHNPWVIVNKVFRLIKTSDTLKKQLPSNPKVCISHCSNKVDY